MIMTIDVIEEIKIHKFYNQSVNLMIKINSKINNL